MRSEPIRIAIEKAGSVKALAELVGIEPQGISQWKRVPLTHVKVIENLTNLPRHVIRPDVYDPPIAQEHVEKQRGEAA